MAASYEVLAASIVNLVLLLMKRLCLNKISPKGAKDIPLYKNAK